MTMINNEREILIDGSPDKEYLRIFSNFLKENNITIITKEEAEKLKIFFKENKNVEGNEINVANLFNYYSVNNYGYSLFTFYRSLHFSKELQNTMTNTIRKKGLYYYLE